MLLTRATRRRGPTAGERFLVYGLGGWAVDSLYVWLHTGRRRPSSLLNVPVYGLALPLFEPLHDLVRHRPLVVRGAVYGLGILGVEYAGGSVLRRLTGEAPWDYGMARLGINGLVRLDYLPLWGAFGLGLERLHDALCPGLAAEAVPADLPRGERFSVQRTACLCAGVCTSSEHG